MKMFFDWPAPPEQPQYFEYAQPTAPQQNTYAQQPVQPQYDYTQQPVQPQQTDYTQQQYDYTQQQPYNYAQQAPQQPVYYYPVQPPQQGGGAAKGFAITSFVFGCLCIFSVLFWLMTFFAFTAHSFDYSGMDRFSAFAALFAISFGHAVFFGTPGLVFGIIAIVKKTKLMPLAVLGVVFSGLLFLESALSFIALI